MENMIINEKTINKNIQYVLSVIAENVDKDGNLIVPKPTSMNETAELFAKMVGNPQKSFADMAKSPKSNQLYVAYGKVKEDVQKYGNLPVPLEIRNPVTKFMKNIGYGKGYKYEHSKEAKKTDQEYMPKELEGKKYL